MTKWKGIAMVAGAVLVHLTLGTIYTFGNMTTYIASYYKNYLKQDIKLADLTWVYSAMIGAMGACMSIGGILERRLGTRLTAVIGCSIMITGIFVTYITVNYHYAWIIVTYGIMYGGGIALPYIALLSCGMRWFPEKRGVVSGIVVAGFGLGTLFFNLIQTAYLNSENVLPNEEGFFEDEALIQRVPSIFLVLGGTYLSMQVIGIILANSPPTVAEISKEASVDNSVLAKLTINKQGNKENGIDGMDVEGNTVVELLNVEQQAPVEPVQKHYTPMELIKTREFYLMWFTFFFNAHTANFVSSMYKVFGQTFIKDDLFLAIVGSIGAVFNAGGRVGWGFVIDRFSYKTCLRVMLGLQLIFLLTMPATPMMGKYPYALWIFCIQILISASFVLFPAFTSKYFGSKYAGTNYGLVFTQMIIGGPTSGILIKVLIEPIGFMGMFFLYSGFTVISILLTFPFREELYVPAQKPTPPIATNNRKQ